MAATQPMPRQQVTSASYVTLRVFTLGVSPPANSLMPEVLKLRNEREPFIVQINSNRLIYFGEMNSRIL
jgi:hypothetical protein